MSVPCVVSGTYKQLEVICSWRWALRQARHCAWGTHGANETLPSRSTETPASLCAHHGLLDQSSELWDCQSPLKTKLCDPDKALGL